MNQLELFKSPVWSVSDLTKYLRELLENDHSLQDLWILGEISNLSLPTSGHLYLTIKDRTSSIKCVMWRNFASRLDFSPYDGQAVEIHGSISIYEVSGQYQLYADDMRPAGEGELYKEYLRLKRKLDEEGLFDSERKRPIPEWPNRIGVVTSPTGAALRDILNIVGRRFPIGEIILSPSPVQGESAPAEIATAIDRINMIAKPDVIILARGGGSIEDLWAFNTEVVARAIVESKAPIITGVGHETDFTIADFSSDLRAPTPTAAAELAVPNLQEIHNYVIKLDDRLRQRAGTLISSHQNHTHQLLNRLDSLSPLNQIRSSRQRVDELSLQNIRKLRNILQIHKLNLDSVDSKLSTLDPRAILSRGYAVLSKLDGQLVRSINQVKPKDHLNVQLSDGRFNVLVDEDTKDDQ